MRRRIGRALRLWILALVVLWSLGVLATSGRDPAGPLALLLVVCGGSLLLLAWRIPPEDAGSIRAGRR